MSMRMASAVSLAAGALLVSACSSAMADKPHGAAARVAVVPAPDPVAVETPVAQPSYQVELVSETGALLPTYLHKSRYYVMGLAGTRYGVKITNPTDTRVEAVISIDGLDALDGEDATPKKRGYVIPAYQSITIEGFRVSMNDVAAFRFGSVGRSYAASKGKARNVGVVGVAFFREKAAPEPVQIPYPVYDPCPNCDYGGPPPGASPRGGADGDESASTGEIKAGGRGNVRRPSTDARPQKSAPSATGAPPMRPTDKDMARNEEPNVMRERPGLGTEYGERRTSAVVRVTFERDTAAPCCLVSLRYNDRGGLVALGIQLEDPVDATEIWTRETANPFPGTEPFSKPPIGWQQ